jgi:hypothetical protein
MQSHRAFEPAAPAYWTCPIQCHRRPSPLPMSYTEIVELPEGRVMAPMSYRNQQSSNTRSITNEESQIV